MLFNRYAYGNNSPHMYVDPDGNMAQFAAAAPCGPAAAICAIGIGIITAWAIDHSIDKALENPNDDIKSLAGPDTYGTPPEGGDEDPNNEVPNWKSTKQFGHTFKTHGQGPKVLRSLTGRTASGNPAQGQWTNNQQAAEYLHGLRGQLSVGENTINIPKGLGHVVNAQGETTGTTVARVIVRSDKTIKTAYPTLP